MCSWGYHVWGAGGGCTVRQVFLSLYPRMYKNHCLLVLLWKKQQTKQTRSTEPSSPFSSAIQNSSCSLCSNQSPSFMDAALSRPWLPGPATGLPHHGPRLQPLPLLWVSGFRSPKTILQALRGGSSEIEGSEQVNWWIGWFQNKEGHGELLVEYSEASGWSRATAHWQSCHLQRTSLISWLICYLPRRVVVRSTWNDFHVKWVEQCREHSSAL